MELLKKKSPAELISQAEKLEIENPSTLRKQEILFAILKKLAKKNEQITGGGVLEVLQDGFGFLRAIESNYLPGPDDIYVSPSQIRKFGLRTGELKPWVDPIYRKIFLPLIVQEKSSHMVFAISTFIFVNRDVRIRKL